MRMVQYIHAVLRNALQNAVREELVARNVAKLVQVETPDYEVGKGLTIAQAQRLLETVKRTRGHSLYVLALMLGLRRGELLGLRWSDVDLEVATLTVRQNLVRASGELRVQAPKTRRSRRTLPLPPPVVAALRQQQARQAEERQSAGSSWAGNDLVFSTSLGTPIEPRNLTRHFYSVRDRAGLPGIRFHDLRHTCLTLLLGLGTPAPHRPGHRRSLARGCHHDDLRTQRDGRADGGPAEAGRSVRFERLMSELDVRHSARHGKSLGCGRICLVRSWWARQVSNLRPLACKASALPLSYAPENRCFGGRGP